uniref:G-protein coupled receptors family 1 profile domain-containing protein n=1 Tax=Varanus komodoensis TaxID=61221 RepID=A0A8D2L1W0_VARKO
MPFPLCFQLNGSCHKALHPTGVQFTIDLVCAMGMLLTVLGNLLVAISILHFKVLHTPTNFLLLSLALADLHRGLTLLPFSIVCSVESRWYFGSVRSVLAGSALPLGLDHLPSFLFPMPAHDRLYVKVFTVATRQAKQISSLNKGAAGSAHPLGALKRERKAAKTLGKAIAIYWLCWLLFTIDTMVDGLLDFITPPLVFDVLIWFAYFNSAYNPLIYVFSYRWFRKAIKLILTRQIFCISTSTVDLYREEGSSGHRVQTTQAMF